MTALLRTPASVVWAVLVLATLATWTLGTQHGIHSHTLASVLILLIAFIKVRLVGLYFMELRESPTVLRGVFEAYCVVVCTGCRRYVSAGLMTGDLTGRASPRSRLTADGV